MNSAAATKGGTDEKSQAMPSIEIRPLRPGDDASAFRSLNEEWIGHFFTLEARDIETLADPEQKILRQGGHIFMAYANSEAIGCVALIAMGNRAFELSKMAVAPHLRGRGIGRSLLQHAIKEARTLGAGSLFLGSSTKLPNAVHLYEALGFRHVPPEDMPPMLYTRANVFMALQL